MKKPFLVITATLLSFSLLGLSACGNSQANLSGEKKEESTAKAESSKGEEAAEKKDASGELLVSTFGLNQDIVESDIIKPFEEANGVKVTLEVGNAAERLTKVESGSSNVDVIELSQSGSTKGYTEGVLEEVTEKDVPNLASLSDEAKQVYQNGGGVPFSINSIGIVYDKEKVGHELKDWADLWSSDLAGKIAVPDITTTAGPLFLSVAADRGEKPFRKTREKLLLKLWKS